MTKQDDNTNLKQRMQQVVEVFSHKIPFHQLLGLRFDRLTAEECRLSFDFKDELVGNPFHGILHGGVTATALDVIGGYMAIAGMLDRNNDISDQALKKRLIKTGTIDLRVDYLRPGRGKSFYAIAKLLRCGSKVAVVRMELHNEKDTLIALGTGTYMTG